MADSWEDDDSEPVLLNVPPSAKVAAAIVPPPAPADDSDDGGNWDDDDFEAPVLPSLNSGANNNDDEEDLVYDELNKKDTNQGAPSKAAQAQARKNAAEEEAIMNQVKNAGFAGETAEQKRLRERQQQEESDIAQAIDAFDGFTVKTEPKKETITHDVFVSLTKGIGSVILKTKQDHTNFGVNTHIKLLNSKAAHIAAFYRGISEILKQNTFTLAILGPIIDDIKKTKDTVEQHERLTGVVHAKKQTSVQTPVVTAAVEADDDGDIWGDEDIVPRRPAPKKEVDEDELLRSEHEKYGSALNLKLARSTPQNITAFFKAFAAILEKVQWNSLDIGEVYECFYSIYAAREKVEAKVPKAKTAKDAKKEKDAEQKRLKAVFGDSDYVDDYGDFSRMEDDYMY
jgi:hypothetical protein